MAETTPTEKPRVSPGPPATRLQDLQGAAADLCRALTKLVEKFTAELGRDAKR